ncbi:MAG: hypothetical protein JW882_09110 [Deltaproteobacteria bacterium]|nr:hypothetical protein [Deltaproteobacteria bacterium]
MSIKRLKKVLLSAVCWAILLLIFVPPSISEENAVEEEDQEIIVIGSGWISEGNVAQARKAAISDALVKGVEGYLTKRLGSQDMVNNFQRVIQDIIPNADEKIENYHILAEHQMDKYLKVLVRVKVNNAMMEGVLKEMGPAQMNGEPIKVLFMVSEEQKEKEKILYWWSDPEEETGLTDTELILHRIFQGLGLTPINRAQEFPGGVYSDEMRKPELADEDIINWGRLFSSDVVVYGMCSFLDEDSIYVMLKSYDIGSGTMAYEDSQVSTIDRSKGGQSHLTQAIERVINSIALKMTPATIGVFDLNQNAVSKMEIELAGLKSFEQFRRLRDFFLNEIEGVNSVIQTRMRANSITVKVEFMGTEDRFIDSILNHDGFPYLAEIRKTEEGIILIQIK